MRLKMSCTFYGLQEALISGQSTSLYLRSSGLWPFLIGCSGLSIIVLFTSGSSKSNGTAYNTEMGKRESMSDILDMLCQVKGEISHGKENKAPKRMICCTNLPEVVLLPSLASAQEEHREKNDKHEETG